MNDRSYDEVMIERFRADPDYAIELLNDILDDGDDQGELAVLLRQMSAAFGKPDKSETTQGICDVARVFRTMGLRLFVEPAQAKQREMAYA
jgi:DNA-binding phage protein